MSELRTNKIVPRDGIPTSTSGTRNGGGILQVVYAQKKDTQTITGNDQRDDIDISGLSFTIKPSSSSSLILIQASISAFVDANQQMSFSLKANGNIITDALGDAGNSTQKRIVASAHGNQSNNDDWVLGNTSFSYLHAPATTSNVTYQVTLAMATTTGTSYINRTERDGGYTYYDYRGISTVTGMEVSA
mgnify:FL=1